MDSLDYLAVSVDIVSSELPLLSVVMPAHEEVGVVSKAIHRLKAVEGQLQCRLEVIVVSDGSQDATYEEAQSTLTGLLPGAVVELVSSVGSHLAIHCGLRYAKGDYIAVMACDGQDPFEILPQMLGAFRPEVDIVWGRRRHRQYDAMIKAGMSRLYYRFFRVVTGLQFPPDGLDFFMVRQRVVRFVLDHNQRNISLFLLIFNAGFAQAFIDYDRGERAGQRSSWTLRKRLRLAVDMLTSFSAAPIRIVSLIGAVVGSSGIIIGGVTLFRAIFGDVPIPGWASLMVVTSTMSGLILVALGLLGEYVWRILDEVRRRPLYIEGRYQRIQNK